MFWLMSMAKKLAGIALLIPLPVKLAVGLLGALSVTERVPVRVPVAVGVKVTVTVQVACDASELGQLLPCAKSPVVEMLEMVTAVD